MARHYTFQWTPEADALLGKYPDAELARRWKVSTMVVYYRRTKLGIAPCRTHTKTGKKLKMPPLEMKFFWTPERVALLGTATDTVIAKKLGVSHWWLQQERVRMGIPAYGQGGDAAKRLEELRPTLGSMRDVDAAKILGVTRERVRQLRNKLGLPVYCPWHARVGEKNAHGVEMIGVVGRIGYTGWLLRYRCPCGRTFEGPSRRFDDRTGRRSCGLCVRVERGGTVYERRGMVGKKVEGTRLTLRDVYVLDGVTYGRCDCDCGGKWEGIMNNLVRAASKSCGCLAWENGTYQLLKAMGKIEAGEQSPPASS